MRSTMRRLAVTGLVWAGLLGCACLSTQSALALTGHGLAGLAGAHVDKTTAANLCAVSSGDECGPGAPGSGEGEFKEPAGVAVDDLAGPAEGDVYVVDAGNNRVERLSADGAFIGEFDGSGSHVGEAMAAPTGQIAPPASLPEHGTVYNIAVDDDPASVSAGDVYVVDPGHNVIDKFSATGEYISQLTGFSSAVYGVAVDRSGDVWVAEEDTEVREFDDSLANQPLAGPLPFEFRRNPGIAVDSQDNVYLVRGNPFVAKFNSTGGLLAEEVTSCVCTTGLAMDESTDNLYVDQGTSVAEYGPFGEPFTRPIESFAEGGQLGDGSGIALNAATGSVYVADTANNDIDIFSVVTLPDVVTGEATDVQPRSATLSGTVNPDGVAARYYFEYGTSPSLGSFSPSLPGGDAGAGAEPEEVSRALSPLIPNTTYYYRLVAANKDGHTPGALSEFHTPPGPPLVSTGSVTSVSPLDATVAGTVNAGSLQTTYRYEYGPTTAYGHTTPTSSAGAEDNDVVSYATLSDLSAGTLYHYRLVAVNDVGTSYGEDSTLTTPAAAGPTVATGAVSDVGIATATISATIDTQGLPTNYGFQLGAAAGSYGATTGSANVGPGLGEVAVSLALQNLQPGTTYHYRVIAENLYGTSTGADQAFTTPAVLSSLSQPPAAPLIATPALAFPAQTGASAPATTKVLTRAQKLTRALRACAKKPKRQRAGCERQARKSYGPVTKKKTAKK
jgi:hypothetical protein